MVIYLGRKNYKGGQFLYGDECNLVVFVKILILEYIHRIVTLKHFQVCVNCWLKYKMLKNLAFGFFRYWHDTLCCCRSPLAGCEAEADTLGRPHVSLWHLDPVLLKGCWRGDGPDSWGVEGHCCQPRPGGPSCQLQVPPRRGVKLSSVLSILIQRNGLHSLFVLFLLLF